MTSGSYSLSAFDPQHRPTHHYVIAVVILLSILPVIIMSLARKGRCRLHRRLRKSKQCQRQVPRHHLRYRPRPDPRDVSRAMDGLASGLSLTPQEAWSAIEKDSRWLDWQEGRISPRDCIFIFPNVLAPRLPFRAIQRSLESALDPTRSIRNRFSRISRKLPPRLTFEHRPYPHVNDEARFPSRFFPIRIYSYRVGASKPDPIIYREALQAARSGRGSLYIDDIAPTRRPLSARDDRIVFNRPNSSNPISEVLGSASTDPRQQKSAVLSSSRKLC